MRYNKKEEIGKLRERIIVQSVSRSVTTSGFGTETWSNLAEVWAVVDYKGVNPD
jgi:head-tail adaptor